MNIELSSFEEFKSEIAKALSTNGYFIKTGENLPVRTQLTLAFSIKGEANRLQFNCEVVYVGNGGIGVTFTENASSLKEKFLNFMKPQDTSDAQAAKPQVETVKPAEAPSPDIEQAQPLKESAAAGAAIAKETDDLSADDDDSSDGLIRPIPQGEGAQGITPGIIRTVEGKLRNVLRFESSKKKAGEKDMMADFGELSFTKVLLTAFEAKISGSLHLRNQQIEKVVYFKGGRPVFVESNPPLLEESIGQILLEKERIKKEDLQRAVEYVEEHGCRIGEAMMKLKMVSPTLLKDALTFQLKIKLYELFKWKEADFKMEVMNVMPHKFGTRPLNVINTIYRGLKEKLKDQYPQELEQYISPIYNKYLTQKENPLFDIENLGFNNSEKRFWELLLKGKMRVRQIFEGSTMNKPDTFRFLYALLELDLVNINDEPTLDIPNIEKDIFNRSRFMEKMNYFDVLQIHWSANNEKIKENYEKHLKLTLEEKKTPNLSSEGLSNLDKIAGILKRAYDELSDNARRREYRKTVLGESESQIAAELAARQAQLAEFKNDMKEARHLIQIAMDLAPANAEYRALNRKYGGKAN